MGSQRVYNFSALGISEEYQMQRGGLKREKPEQQKEEFQFIAIPGADTLYTVLQDGQLRGGVLNEFSSGCSTEFAPASLNKMPACTCPKATCKEGTEASWQRLFSRHFRGQGWPRSVGLSAVGYFWWSFPSCFRTRSDIICQTMTILLSSGNPAMEHSLTFKKVESPKMGSSR